MINTYPQILNIIWSVNIYFSIYKCPINISLYWKRHVLHNGILALNFEVKFLSGVIEKHIYSLLDFMGDIIFITYTGQGQGQ